MMRYIIFVSSIMISLSGWAAGGGEELHADINLSDRTSLQRGATVFVNYCLSCHSATYMRFNRMAEDLGITEEVLKSNFMFATDKSGDTMQVSMNSEDGEQYFGVAPPDLSVTARARGANWLYSYFMTFYIDENRPWGVNNQIFKDVAMPHVLWEFQGLQEAVLVEERNDNNQPVMRIDHLEQVTPGTVSPEEYEVLVNDLVNFLVYLGEPIQLKRYTIGSWVIVYLVILLFVLYHLKKEYWRDVH
jgi:ubiquinol-cytochrome c reductase cytochrome c1 subunit